jgi:signal transduction histidine kinase
MRTRRRPGRRRDRADGAAERIPRESDAPFRLALRNSPVIVSTVDGDLRYTWLYNPHPAFRAEVCIGRRDDELAPPEHTAELVALKRDVLASGRGERREVRVRVGSAVHIYDVAAEPLFDDGGGITGVAVAATDVTTCRREEQGKEILARAGLLLSSSLEHDEMLRSIARLVVPELADWCVIDLLGDDGLLECVLTEAAAPGKAALLRTMLARYPHDPAPEDHPVAGVLRGGGPLLLGDIDAAVLDRAAHDAEHRALLEALGPVSSMIVPLVAHGRVLGAVTLTSAESGRRYGQGDLALAEELGRRAALAVENAKLYRITRRERERMARLQQVTAALSEALTPAEVADVVVRQGVEALGAVGGGVAVLSEDGSTLHLLAMTGFPRATWDTWASFPVAASVPMAEVARTGEVVDVREPEAGRRFPDLRSVLSPGQRAWAAAPLMVEGRIIGSIGLAFAEDAPLPAADRELLLAIARLCAQALARARHYERERRAVQTRDEVLAVVAHDLRNPLGAIGMFAHLLEETLPPDDAECDHARSIRALTEQASRLIQDLLDVSRMEAGRFHLELHPVPVRGLLSQAVDMLAGAAAGKGVALERVVEDALPPVPADLHRVTQVLSNLLANAIRFTPAGGRIVVRAAPGEQEVVFSVSDTGPGIAPEHLPFVFDRFWQARKSERAGAGLGLAIARGIVEAHRGRMWVESEPGRGSTFWFTLPVAAGAGEE